MLFFNTFHGMRNPPKSVASFPPCTDVNALFGRVGGLDHTERMP